MFFAALFAVANTWNQPTVFQWMNRYRKCNIYTKKNTTHLKREGNPVIYDNMDEPSRHYNVWNKPRTNSVWSHLHVKSKKVKLINAESRMWFPGAGGERGNTCYWIYSFSLTGWIIYRHLLYITGDYSSNILNLKITKRSEFKVSSHKDKYMRC
jgi:hypothetical protein